MGAIFRTLSNQMMAFVPVIKAVVDVHIMIEQAPTFHVFTMLFEKERSSSMHARKFAIETRGNAAFMDKG